MRGLSLVLAVLMLLAPLAAASDGSGDSGSGSSSSSSSPSPSPGNEGNGTSGNSTAPPPKATCPAPPKTPSTPEEYQACKERYCGEHPADERCHAPAPSPASKTGWERWCKPEQDSDASRQRCRAELAAFGPGHEGKWVSFGVDAPNATLLDYRVGGALLLSSLHLETGSDNLTVERMGSTLRIGDDDTELVLHDDPTGLLGFKGADGSAALAFPLAARVDHAADGSVARIALSDGRQATFRSDNATWLDSHTVLVSGFFALLLPPPPQKEGHDSIVQGEVKQAIEDRKVGAEITLKAPEAPGHAATTKDNGSVQVLAYDNVSVQVRMPASRIATREAPIRVELSAGLHEGRTIVLNLNRSLLASNDPGSLALRYYDLNDQSDGSTLETEVHFGQASSLQDVLDPGNDGGQPEYWVVQDANGLQVLASIPHWSAHAITVASIAQVIAQPNVTYGIVAGGVGTLLAAVALMWPRRPDEF